MEKFGERVVSRENGAAGGSALCPLTIATAAELVEFAHSAGCRVVPIGSGSKLDWGAGVSTADAAAFPSKAGGTPASRVVYMDTRLCGQVIEYAPEDMTISVEAGITLAALSDVLSRHKQRVALDPPHADRATVGGVLAANDSGPIRLAYGAARDAVIGMSMIQADGTVIKSGGKVVKNVAGYDLHKLYIGSFGALGVIATVTFRLRPLPEARGVVAIEPVDAVDADRMVAALLDGPTRPTFIEILNARIAAPWRSATGLC